jgi:hypothetical protein
MPHGGFYKLPAKYSAKWNGSATRSEWYGANKVELGTIDNDATVTEIMFLANVYGRTKNDNPPGTGKQYDIMNVEAERRYGYEWGGSYGTKLFAYTKTVGY